MCCCSCFFNLLIFTVVSLMIDEGIAATTARPSNRPWAAISPLLRNSFGDEDSQQCQCVMFYLCDDATTVKNDTHCEEPQVCCKTDFPAIIQELGMDTTGEIPSISSTSTTESFIDNQPPVVSTSTESSTNGQSAYSSTSASSSSVECSIRKRTDQILISDENSNPALFGEFPWMVAIFKTSESSPDGTLICGGSLLSSTIVLTAAHCIHNIDPNTIRVRAGDFIINGDTDERLAHQDRMVNIINKHGNFSSKALYNDLALIRVNEPFNYEDHIAPVCSPLIDTSYFTPSSFDSQNCLVTGWTRNTDNTVQNKLRKVSATILTNENCENNLQQTRLGRLFKLHPSFLCAKEQDSVCKGNGGGPLFCASQSNPNKYVQVGVISWGVGCDINIPGVYASLGNNAEWLTTEFNNLNRARPL